MKVISILLLILTIASFQLYAEQENYYPKGNFEYSPPSRLRESRLNNAENQRDIQIWSDNFESNNGWTLGGCWQTGPVEVGPSSAHAGAACMGTNLNGLYSNNSNITAASVTVNIPPASYVELSFYEWFELESGYDFGYVEIVAGQTYRLDARTGVSGNEWRQTALNLTQFAGQTIRISFRLVSDVSVPGAGWYIDDLDLFAQEPLPLTLNIAGVNTSNFPSIYINGMVNNLTGPVDDLTTSNFNIFENEIPQTTNLTVISPANVQQTSSADIVFVLDVTGSMTEEIQAVQQNMLSFVNSLTTQNVDYRIGLVVFGDIVYVYNSYAFYTNQQQILSLINSVSLGEHGIGSGGDYPENQVEAMAEASLFSWRPGAARVLIMLTDATSHQNDNVTAWTFTNLLAARLLPNDIIAFPIFNTSQPDQIAQYVPIADATNPDGTYYDIYDNFNDIISQISEFIGNFYTIHYTSTTPLESPITRIVRVQATLGTETAEDYCYYLPGMSPAIIRTDQTINYDSIAQPAGTNRTISILVNDIVPPGVQSASLYWRHPGQTAYSQVMMTMIEPGLYSGTIPAAQATGYGIEYYLSATDGQSTNTLPSANPENFPFSFAIAPNAPAVINITTQTYNSTTGLTVTASASSAQSLSLVLYYRPMGALVYDYMPMTHTTGNSYTVNLNQTVSDFGMQFFIKATTTTGLVTYKGYYDMPYLVLHSAAQDTPEPEADCCVYDLMCMPNPINGSTPNVALAQISFRLDKQANIKTTIYNIKGERVKSLSEKTFDVGKHSLWWDLKDERGISTGSGIYLYIIETAGRKQAGKLLILK